MSALDTVAQLQDGEGTGGTGIAKIRGENLGKKHQTRFLG